jgi:hypothetical protein
VDFLLECIGFPPETDRSRLISTVLEKGEPIAWRGPAGTHLRYPLEGGLEVRLDRDEGEDHWSLWPWFDVPRRLRVRVSSLLPIPDSPFDLLLHGTANPAPPELGVWGPEDVGLEYPLAVCLGDARRLPRTVGAGHVLAISLAGFALDVDYVGPNTGVRDPAILEEPCGAELMPLGGDDRPGGAMELSMRIRAVRHLRNPLSGEHVEVLEVDAPGRPLDLFVSRWQLSAEGLAAPRPGWRIEGVFLFTGRVAGGLPAARAGRARRAFG